MIKHVVIKERKVTEKKDQEIETNAHVDENISGKPTSGNPNILLVDCGATAHIVTDMSKFDDTFKPDKHFIELAIELKQITLP